MRIIVNVIIMGEKYDQFHTDAVILLVMKNNLSDERNPITCLTNQKFEIEIAYSTHSCFRYRVFFLNFFFLLWLDDYNESLLESVTKVLRVLLKWNNWTSSCGYDFTDAINFSRCKYKSYSDLCSFSKENVMI